MRWPFAPVGTDRTTVPATIPAFGETRRLQGGSEGSRVCECFAETTQSVCCVSASFVFRDSWQAGILHLLNAPLVNRRGRGASGKWKAANSWQNTRAALELRDSELVQIKAAAQRFLVAILLRSCWSNGRRFVGSVESSKNQQAASDAHRICRRQLSDNQAIHFPFRIAVAQFLI